jgi:UDP-glucose 4-epimerase
VRILITGGAGFLGSHLAEALLAQGHSVSVVDDLSAGTTDNLLPEVEFFQEDITGPGLERAFAGEPYGAVVHCAANVSVILSMADPMTDMRVGLVGTHAVLRQCLAHGNPKFVFLSSGGAIYGECPTPKTEVDFPAPTSFYGVHKYAAERYVEMSGLPYTILRLANVYGPRQRAGNEGGVVAVFLERAMTGQGIDIYGDGEQARDFIYSADVVRAAVFAATGPQTGLWNIGTGVETTVNQLVAAIGTTTGKDLPVSYHPARRGEITRSCLSIHRSLADGWWAPRLSLAAGIAATAGQVVRG